MMRKIIVAGIVLGLALTAVSAARADTLGDLLALFGFGVSDDGGAQPDNDGGGSGSVA